MPSLIPHDELRAAAHLVSDLRLRGGVVRLVRDTLQVFPPRGGLSPKLRAALDAHREAVARLLGCAPRLAPAATVQIMRPPELGRRPSPTCVAPEPSSQATRPPPSQPHPPAAAPGPQPEATRSAEDLRHLQGRWVRTGGGGRRYVLPRLKPPMFALLRLLEPEWRTFHRSTSDRRTRRALARRGLAEFRELPRDMVRGRLTAPGVEVRDAHLRKLAHRQRRAQQWAPRA